ncbi:MAG: phosphate ABC transporter ATP-binding protein [Anaerolineae bacterium]
MTEPLFRLKEVVKRYGEREVLHIGALDVFRGEILGIVGPNGAGKSTLLRLLNFLEPPTSGTIIFNGQRPLTHNPYPIALRRQVTTVFQRPVLLNTSVYHNVAYGLKIRGEKEVDRRVREVLEQVGLSQFAREPVRNLSGGEVQRVALARALIIEPEVLLLDEPAANLDPYNVKLIEEIIAALNRERGTTMVLVTHNVFQARRLAHRVGLLLEGKLIEVGSVTEFFTSPRDPRTRAFVRGEMVY